MLTRKFIFIHVQAHKPYPWHQTAFLRTKTEPQTCCYPKIISDFTCPLPCLCSAFLLLTMACLSWFLVWSWLVLDWGLYPPIPDLTTASSWPWLVSADPLAWSRLAAAVCSSVPTSSHPNYLFPGPFLSVCTSTAVRPASSKELLWIGLLASMPLFALSLPALCSGSVWTRGVKGTPGHLCL